MTPNFDVVVAGAGPGGIAAATVAAEAGLRVCLVDDNPAAGGQIWRGQADSAGAGSRDARKWMQRLNASGCTVWTGLRVVSEPAAQMLRLEGQDTVRDVAFGRLIVATGARERFLSFPGWTLPGVMGAGAAQAFLKAGFEVSGRRAVVSGSGPLLLAVAAGLRSKGARVAGIFEQAPAAQLAQFARTLARHPGKLLEGVQYQWQARFAPYRTGCWVVKAEGGEQLERVTVSNGRRQWRIDCDLLACGYNLVPNLELPLLLGCRVEQGLVHVDEGQQSSRADVLCVGELTGVGGLEKALLEGEIAGWTVAGDRARAAALRVSLRRQNGFAQGLAQAFALRPELRSLPAAETLVCRCEDVSYGALCQQDSWRAAKLQTRVGMGACQGRVCGSAAAFLLGWEKHEKRPPVFPTTVAGMAAEIAEIEK
jgi:D-hydroxyproline dehydrogenase subunit alpha